MARPKKNQSSTSKPVTPSPAARGLGKSGLPTADYPPRREDHAPTVCRYRRLRARSSRRRRYSTPSCRILRVDERLPRMLKVRP